LPGISEAVIRNPCDLRGFIKNILYGFLKIREPLFQNKKIPLNIFEVTFRKYLVYFFLEQDSGLVFRVFQEKDIFF